MMKVATEEKIESIKERFFRMLWKDRDAILVLADSNLSKLEFQYKSKIIPECLKITEIDLPNNCYLHCSDVPEIHYTLNIYIRFLFRTIHLDVNIEDLTVLKLGTFLQNKIGLPVSAFWLKHPKRQCQLYDQHLLQTYNIMTGDTLDLVVRDKSDVLLSAVFHNDVSKTNSVIKIYSDDYYVNSYFWRVVLCVAAHYNYKSIAAVAVQGGIR